jgi:hypothetical protein
MRPTVNPDREGCNPVRPTPRIRNVVAIAVSGAVAGVAVAAPAAAHMPPPASPAQAHTPTHSHPAPAKRSRTPKHVTCTVNLFAIIKQPAPTAANFGTTRCNRGLGTGVQQDSSTTTRTSPTTGSFSGPWKMFFDEGTLYGTFSISFVTTLEPLMTDPPSFAIRGVAYTGTLRVTRGSGRYAHVRGSGTLTGASPDAVQTRLDEHLTLTGL